MDLQYRQEQQELEINKKSINLQETALDLKYKYIQAKEQCESVSVHSNKACEAMKDFESQLKANSILRIREYAKLGHCTLDSQLIGTYIAKKTSKFLKNLKIRKIL